MTNDNKTTKITEEDIAFADEELRQVTRPLTLHEIAQKLAFQKTASQRTQEVKVYDPNGLYEVGDFIYKEYDEPLTVSSKTVEHFKGAVVLRVVSKLFFKSFNCEMMEVDYDGGGVFRKYIDYMKKTKTQVLLPSNCDGRGAAPGKIGKEEDPRLTELPMPDKDLKAMEKNLRTSLSKSPKFFGWNDYWQLAERQVPIPEEKIKEIEGSFEGTKESVTTESLVERFFGLEPSRDLFELHCLSLSYALEKKYKKEFISISISNWGKWHLKKILNSLPENLPLSAALAKLPEYEETEKPEISGVHDFPIKVYLSWREIISGGIRIPRSLNKELSHAREFSFTDQDDGKTYTLYYFPNQCFFLGLKDYFATNNIPQGASLTIERKGPAQFNFWLKRQKKKLPVVKLAYDPKEDRFSDSGEEAFTYSLPNKIIYLEKEVLSKLFPLYELRSDLNLKELLILIFKGFGLQGNIYSLHYLRAYHLVDVLKETTIEDVESVLLNHPEFSKSEKKKGIFYYQEPEEIKVEEAYELGLEITPEVPLEGLPEEAVEMTAAEARAETREAEAAQVPPVVVPEKIKIEIPPPPKKEKPVKKKKAKIEGEKAPRLRKSEKRFIEEKIEIEESEQEALSALKEEEGEEEVKVEKKVEKKEPVEAPEPAAEAAPPVPVEPSFGIFAEKLKSALTKKQKDEDQKK